VRRSWEKGATFLGKHTTFLGKHTTFLGKTYDVLREKVRRF
jgi:hypothetical protein